MGECVAGRLHHRVRPGERAAPTADRKLFPKSDYLTPLSRRRHSMNSSSRASMAQHPAAVLTDEIMAELVLMETLGSFTTQIQGWLTCSFIISATVAADTELG